MTWSTISIASCLGCAGYNLWAGDWYAFHILTGLAVLLLIQRYEDQRQGRIG